MQFVSGKKPTKADRTWPFKPSMIQSRSIARPPKPPCPGWPWVVGTRYLLLDFWGGEWCHGGFKLFFYCAVVCFLFRPFILICHDHCCCRTTSRMLKRPYCGQEHWLPGRWPLFKTNVISKWCFCHYATCSTQSNLVYSTCCIISKQSTKHVFSFLFFHDLWSKVSIYTPNNEASWKGRITIPPLASIKKTLPAGLRDRHLVCSLQCAGGSMASFLARRASVVNVGKSFWLFEIVVCCLAAWSFCHCYIYVSAESNVLIHVL